ncbi:RraA family protein [Ktedonobacter racemifer]|jgi:4-hydroxy-4-methyl-2-oxoglutarate aldolase|uniref:Putative 4-hydroxy-4-methyl-2-oxoglutarate aldolase n=1 Tax=Ktedonobacter racemifer DSM 44963 TaxID=485913 RepID=D6U082_KTERA|nr:RraA family protein [Ktedonobacter racemifer]EFH82222.1 Dimethylmenaquinone methyltransferase [Ktedonobacter racemifer DSM 44963]
MREYPEWLSATLASDASEGKGVLPNYILPLLPGSRVVGPAYVALMSQDDNLAIRKVLEAPPEPGTVLVVAGGHASRTATVGDLLALEMQNAGLAGLITDGLVRDSREIRALEVFRVWCRGVTPTASRKDGPAVVGGRITFEETVVRDGDLVIADDDGVVIWPQEQIEILLTRAEARLQQDNERLARLRAQQR